jgi:hypothetical protein
MVFSLLVAAGGVGLQTLFFTQKPLISYAYIANIVEYMAAL